MFCGGRPSTASLTASTSMKALPSARCLNWLTPLTDILMLSMSGIVSSACPCSVTASVRGYSGPLKAIRTIPNALLIKVFFLDLDVKAAGYANTDEAMRELNAKCLTIGIPFPSIIVFSSAPLDGSAATHSSLHVYWVLTRALTREEWLPIARALQAALEKHGLIFDPVCTNFAGVLRPLGSLNKKYDPFRIARLAFWGTGPDYDPDEFSRPLAPFRASAQSLAYDSDREVAPDLAELADAVEYRSDRGHYARGRYHAMLELHFGLAHHVTARPELLDDARAIIQRVVLANDRVIAFNERSLFEEAVDAHRGPARAPTMRW